MKKIQKVIYNWYIDPDNDPIESYFALNEAIVPFLDWGIITDIIEHELQVEGDKYWIDVFFENGNSQRIFNPNQILRY